MLPFLARYRREATGEMGPDILRQVKDTLEVLKTVKNKAWKALGMQLRSWGKLSPFLNRSILFSQSLQEFEHLYHLINLAPKLLWQKFGLESMAEETLTGRGVVNLASMVEKGTKGKKIMEEVKKDVQHIMVDLMVHDRDMTDVIKNLQGDCYLT